MKTKPGKKAKVNIVTLGCAKNLVDSEVLLTQLRGGNIDSSHQDNSEDANVIIINTCGFIDNAKQESIDTILHYVEAKKKGEIDKLYVTGCLSQRYKADLEKEIPEVDDYFGTMDLPALLRKFNVDYKHELLGERIISTANHYAYLKISEGCDRPCAFCAIPLMRGGHVSRPMDDLINETRNLVRNGTKEILLIAQDSTYYGLDLYKKRKLAELMDRLSDLDGVEWLRLHYAFPTGFPKDVLEVMAKKTNICNYLDIPLQHGSTKMLQLMRRGITREKTEMLLNNIRGKVPGIAIRTTLIAGHPGETEKDFEEMMDFVNQSQFERLGIFTYSHEENTHSFTFKDEVSEKVKQARANAVMELQESISFKHNQKLIGQTMKVLIDQKEGDYFIGRTEFDSPEVDNEVIINARNAYLPIGGFVNIKVTGATEFDLKGEPVTKSVLSKI